MRKDFEKCDKHWIPPPSTISHLVTSSTASIQPIQVSITNQPTDRPKRQGKQKAAAEISFNMKYTTNVDNQNSSNVNNHNSSIINNSHSINNSVSAATAAAAAAAIAVTSSTSPTTTNGGSTNTTGNNLFCEQVNTVTNLFEKWNDCERTVVMYALLKRMRYPSLKFLQYSIDNTLTQNMGSTSNLSTVVIDMNANNPSYLQNLLNAYKTFHLGDLVDTLSSSSSSDKDSMPSCYGSDFQLTHCDERKLYGKKEDILHEVLHMLPLLKPGNEEAKIIYMTLIPLAVKDTIKQIVPTELVQQIFSYMLIHSAISSDDRRTLNNWLRHLEDHLQAANNCASFNMSMPPPPLPAHATNFMSNHNSLVGSLLLENPTMTTSGSSATSSSSSALSNASTASNNSVASSFGNLTQNCNSTTISQSIMGSRNTDWQTIQPPSRQQQQQLQQAQQQKPPSSITPDWSSLVVKSNGNTVNNGGGGNGANSVGVGVGVVGTTTIADQLCDNLNGITLNELASSQNSLGLNIGTSIVDSLGVVDTNNCSSLVNGLAAAAASATASSVATTPSLFGVQTNPIINIINNNNTCNSQLNGIDDHDTSFSKNGTEILDFDPNSNAINNCDSCSNSSSSNLGQLPSQMGYASILMSNCGDHLDINRWSLDSKFAALKTRRSNSLTTQTISSSASSSNSSVITVNDNCSNSTENLAQFANKPRSFSLSIEHHRGSLTNSGSDTRLDEFKPSYIKFQTRNVGMSSIGLWLKSLRLHKYIELFKNMTYEDMLQISEDYLQSLGVTKGASHKLALCIEKLKERSNHLAKMEQELMNGQLKLQAAVEELANIVLTPMKPIELVVAGEDNVALMFLKIVDLVCTIAQKDPYAVVDDDNISVILWILDRSIHNEAFVNHVNQLKELKFKLSKLKMSLTPKMHHTKNGSNGNLNKPRWNGKARKCDQKNGSNDRINHRKNSNDMLNFSLSCLQQQHHHNQQLQQQQQQHNQQLADYDKYNHSNNNNSNNNNNNNNNTNNQYKNAAYQNYQQQQQQQLQPQMLQQHSHFPALPQHHQQQQQQNQQHRRSLNNLIVVSGGPQQPQKMIFKPGQAILSTTNSLNSDDMTTIEMIKQQQQSRKASLPTMNNNNLESLQQQQVVGQVSGGTAQQQQHTLASTTAAVTSSSVPKKTMAAVVMVSTDDLMHASASGSVVTPNSNIVVLPPQTQSQLTPPQQQQVPPPKPHILITTNSPQQQQQQQQNNNHLLNTNNIIVQQQHQHMLQQQQLQLLAAAAAAVGNSCHGGGGGGAAGGHVHGHGLSNNSSASSILHCSLCSTNSNNNNINNNNNNTSSKICSNCCAQNNIVAAAPLSLTLPTLSENYAATHPSVTSNGTNNLEIGKCSASSSATKSCNSNSDCLNDINSLEQLETLCLQMTEQAIN